MKWNHILECQPKDRSTIVQIDPPYKGDYAMGMRIYKDLLPWEDYMKWCTENDCMPNFWWVYAKDFPFPDQPIQ
jgi:hypothetical protein